MLFILIIIIVRLYFRNDSVSLIFRATNKFNPKIRWTVNFWWLPYCISLNILYGKSVSMATVATVATVRPVNVFPNTFVSGYFRNKVISECVRPFRIKSNDVNSSYHMRFAYGHFLFYHSLVASYTETNDTNESKK